MSLSCAVCGVELTTADGETLVTTDAGPVHAECFEGPVPPGTPSAEERLVLDEYSEIEAENARRRDHGDPPLGAGFAGITIVNGQICADDRSARGLQQMVKEDLETPLDPDRRAL